MSEKEKGKTVLYGIRRTEWFSYDHEPEHGFDSIDLYLNQIIYDVGEEQRTADEINSAFGLTVEDDSFDTLPPKKQMSDVIETLKDFGLYKASASEPNCQAVSAVRWNRDESTLLPVAFATLSEAMEYMKGRILSERNAGVEYEIAEIEACGLLADLVSSAPVDIQKK